MHTHRLFSLCEFPTTITEKPPHRSGPNYQTWWLPPTLWPVKLSILWVPPPDAPLSLAPPSIPAVSTTLDVFQVHPRTTRDSYASLDVLPTCLHPLPVTLWKHHSDGELTRSKSFNASLLPKFHDGAPSDPSGFSLASPIFPHKPTCLHSLSFFYPQISPSPLRCPTLFN